MSTKYWLGGAALVGASYYVYQQRLDQANQPHAHSISLPSFGSSKVDSGVGERTGRQIDESAANARDKFKDLQDDAGKKIDSSLSRLEQERAKAANWTSDKLDNLSDSLSSDAKDAKARADALYEQAHKDDPKGLKKLGKDIKQTAVDAKHETEQRLGDAKDSVVGGVSSLKNSISGSKDRAEHELNKAADSGAGWFGFKDSKSEQLAKDSQKSLEGWGETAKQNADAYYDSLSGTKSGGGLFNWGSKSKDTEDSIKAAYEEAQKIYDDAEAKVASTKKSWFNWKNDDSKRKLHEDAQRELDAAQRNLESTTSKFNEWKERTKNALTSDRTHRGFYDWLRGGTAVQQEELARTASRSLRGWGESAEIFAQDELDEARRNRLYKQGAVDKTAENIQKKLNSWEKWANKKYDSTAQGAQDFYNDAQEAFKDAENETKKNAKSWWSWGSAKSKELDDDARRNFDDAQKRLNEANDNLAKWTSGTAKDLNLKFWSSADDAIHETKKGVDSLNKKTLGGLDEAQKWVKDKK